jgi:hypothetical protein
VGALIFLCVPASSAGRGCCLQAVPNFARREGGAPSTPLYLLSAMGACFDAGSATGRGTAAFVRGEPPHAPCIHGHTLWEPAAVTVPHLLMCTACRRFWHYIDRCQCITVFVGVHSTCMHLHGRSDSVSRQPCCNCSHTPAEPQYCDLFRYIRRFADTAV